MFGLVCWAHLNSYVFFLSKLHSVLITYHVAFVHSCWVKMWMSEQLSQLRMSWTFLLLVNLVLKIPLVLLDSNDQWEVRSTPFHFCVKHSAVLHEATTVFFLIKSLQIILCLYSPVGNLMLTLKSASWELVKRWLSVLTFSGSFSENLLSSLGCVVRILHKRFFP